MSTSPITVNLNNATSSGSTGTGLGQGIDVASIVAQIISADRAPEQVWQQEVSDLSTQATALSSINVDLLALQNTINALTDVTGPLNNLTATSSATSILTATAQAAAVAGNHTVVVTNLANTSSLYTDPVANGAVLSGTLGLKVGSAAVVPITIDSSNNTLATLATYITNQNLGVTANVINDANGQRLALISNATGQAGNLSLAATASQQSYSGTGDGTITALTPGAGAAAETITLTATDDTHFDVTGSVSGSLGTATVGTPFTSANVNFTINAGATDFQAGDAFTLATTPANSTGINFNQVAGVNASLTVDSVPISSSTNTVANVIPGVTLNLLGTAPGSPIQLQVGADTDGVSANINSFVTTYNNLINDINTQFTPPASGGTAPPLEASADLRSLQSSILTDISYSLTGNNGLVNLASLGVNMNNDGTLSVDSTTLNDALANNFPAVQNFFQSTDPANLGFASNFSTDLASLTDPTQGVITLALKENSQTQSDLNSQISDFEDRLMVTQQQLVTQYSQVNAALEQLPLLQAQIAGMLGSLPQ